MRLLERLVSVDNLDFVDFQLYLLKTMDPGPSLLAGALESIDRTTDDMLACYDKVSPLLKLSPGSAGRLKSILSDARLDDDLNGKVHGAYAYRLPMWSEFIFLVTPDDSGMFIAHARFGRARRSATKTEPTAWNFLESELSDYFTQVRDIDIWGHYSTYSVVDEGSGRRYFLRFAWGLLQEICEHPENSVPVKGVPEPEYGT
jgi:hypothetical protein